jgi:hypothetical protein
MDSCCAAHSTKEREGVGCWRLSRPDAYPQIFHKDPGLVLRPPLAWELEPREGYLRAVADFVNRRRHDDPAREDGAVPRASRSLPMVLSWGVEEGLLAADPPVLFHSASRA